MRFDAPTLAHAWLAVAQASSTDKDMPYLYRSVTVEEHPNGVRLLATDRFVLLAAWVQQRPELAGVGVSDAVNAVASA